jgi:hypothetical protein
MSVWYRTGLKCDKMETGSGKQRSSVVEKNRISVRLRLVPGIKEGRIRFCHKKIKKAPVMQVL